jgi:hypothetical protein
MYLLQFTNQTIERLPRSDVDPQCHLDNQSDTLGEYHRGLWDAQSYVGNSFHRHEFVIISMMLPHDNQQGTYGYDGNSASVIFIPCLKNHRALLLSSCTLSLTGHVT